MWVQGERRSPEHHTAPGYAYVCEPCMKISKQRPLPNILQHCIYTFIILTTLANSQHAGQLTVSCHFRLDSELSCCQRQRARAPPPHVSLPLPPRTAPHSLSSCLLHCRSDHWHSQSRRGLPPCFHPPPRNRNCRSQLWIVLSPSM